MAIVLTRFVDGQSVSAATFNASVSEIETELNNILSGATPGTSLVIDGTAGTIRPLKIRTSGVDRWQLGGGSEAEGGADAGTNFFIDRYSDAGALLGRAVEVIRASGEVRLYDLILRDAAGTERTIQIRTGDTSLRWILGANNVAEGGSNAGSDFFINRYDDTGSLLGTPLTITRATGDVGVEGLSVNKAAGTTRELFFRSSGSARWRLMADSAAEGGSNAGSDFYLSRYSDGGSIIDSPIAIVRSTGDVKMDHLVIRNSAGTVRPVYFRTGETSNRWHIGADSSSEAGSNAGSNFVIQGYDDSGSAFSAGPDMVIERASGEVRFGNVVMRNTAGTTREIQYRTGDPTTGNRWSSGATNEAESGSNAGSNFHITRFNDSGVVQEQTIKIIRSTGQVQINSRDLRVGDGAGSPFLRVDGAAGSGRRVGYYTNGSIRWQFLTSGGAESGSNAGSDFNIQSFTDGGVFLANVVTIVRASGNVSLSANLNVTGTLTKGAGTFDIRHPVKPEKRLRHSFVEAPRGDLIYRGRAQLEKGYATVDIDAACGLTPGTFAALTRHNEAQIWIQNETGWEPCRARIENASLIAIECKDHASSDLISWLVLAERNDDFWRECDLTDENGQFILEYIPEEAA